MTPALKALLIAAPLASLVPSASLAASINSWNGTWSGTLNNIEPVSVTIAGGKVVGYTIRGATPYPVQFSNITPTAVSFGDRVNYTVKITKKGVKSASGIAHSPMGDGLASLTKE